MNVKLLLCLSAIFLCFAPLKSPKFTSKSPFRKLFIGAIIVDCSGAGKSKCMMVKNSPEKNWEYFYDVIEGFKHVSKVLNISYLSKLWMCQKG